jgi:hypothetical protein
MGMTLITYIFYLFILYAVYCFGLAAKAGDKPVILSTAFMVKFIFYIKSCAWMVYAYMEGGLNSQRVILYNADTLLAFIVVHFIQLSLRGEMVFNKTDKKRKAL